MVALDVSAERMQRVRGNLKRLGLEATLIVGDASNPDRWWDGQLFERILLDVPCSATGVIRRHPDIKLLRRASDIHSLAGRQADMLSKAWTMLAPGGRLLYASCSALRAENADVIAAFLNAQADARDSTTEVIEQQGLVDARQLEPDMPAEKQIGLAIPAGLNGMDGFYYACLQKAF